MNRELADRLARAVLYEGYVLYPYRPSVKNRQRWTFGGLFPESFCRENTAESSCHQVECLVQRFPEAAIECSVRFLHLIDRQVFEFADGYQPVEFLQLGDRQFHTWQEAEERELLLDEVSLGSLVQQPQRRDFSWSGSNRIETLRTADGAPGGRIVREQHAVTGTVELSAVELEHDLYRLTARVCNRTPLRKNASRDEALLRSMASTHLWLEARGGGFVSAIDPPANCREAAAACRNQGLWPVLVGSDGQTDALFAAPIILYDYPQLAPESPGDLFDATEIDEILSLRILTLTENEKQQAAAMDERARALLERTESLDAEQLFELHGTFRRLAGAPVHD